MSKAPAFQLYASDFYMDTTGWDSTQVGIYFRLLMSEWVNGSIPNNTKELARIAQIDHRRLLKWYRPTIEEKFILNGNGNLINKRLEEVRENQRKYRESQTEKGKHGAEKRWSKEIAGAIAQPLPVLKPKVWPDDSSSSSSSKDINNNRNVEISKNVEIPKPWYKNERGNYICSTCQKEFMAYQKLQDHLAAHRGP